MILASHSSNWSDEFRALESVLALSLHHWIVGIEHIGSTAVPGLRAKPILDVDIVMTDYVAFPHIEAVLRRLGYAHHGNQGVPEREAFKRSDDQVPWCEPRRTWMMHHLYVCPVHSRELARHLWFRDALRRRGDFRANYEALKANIETRSGGDRKTYTRIKEIEAREFIEQVLQEEQSCELELARGSAAVEMTSLPVDTGKIRFF